MGERRRQAVEPEATAGSCPPGAEGGEDAGRQQETGGLRRARERPACGRSAARRRRAAGRPAPRGRAGGRTGAAAAPPWPARRLAAADRREAQRRRSEAELERHPERHDRLLEQHVGGDGGLLRHPHHHHAAAEAERHAGNWLAPNSSSAPQHRARCSAPLIRLAPSSGPGAPGRLKGTARLSLRRLHGRSSPLLARAPEPSRLPRLSALRVQERLPSALTGAPAPRPRAGG